MIRPTYISLLMDLRDCPQWPHSASCKAKGCVMIRTTNLPNGLTHIRHLSSGLTALANNDGSYRSGVHNVWLVWSSPSMSTAENAHATLEG